MAAVPPAAAGSSLMPSALSQARRSKGASGAPRAPLRKETPLHARVAAADAQADPSQRTPSKGKEKKTNGRAHPSRGAVAEETAGKSVGDSSAGRETPVKDVPFSLFVDGRAEARMFTATATAVASPLPKVAATDPTFVTAVSTSSSSSAASAPSSTSTTDPAPVLPLSHTAKLICGSQRPSRTASTARLNKTPRAARGPAGLQKQTSVAASLVPSTPHAAFSPGAGSLGSAGRSQTLPPTPTHEQQHSAASSGPQHLPMATADASTEDGVSVLLSHLPHADNAAAAVSKRASSLSHAGAATHRGGDTGDGGRSQPSTSTSRRPARLANATPTSSLPVHTSSPLTASAPSAALNAGVAAPTIPSSSPARTATAASSVGSNVGAVAASAIAGSVTLGPGAARPESPAALCGASSMECIPAAVASVGSPLRLGMAYSCPRITTGDGDGSPFSSMCASPEPSAMTLGGRTATASANVIATIAANAATVASGGAADALKSRFGRAAVQDAGQAGNRITISPSAPRLVHSAPTSPATERAASSRGSGIALPTRLHLGVGSAAGGKQRALAVISPHALLSQSKLSAMKAKVQPLDATTTSSAVAVASSNAGPLSTTNSPATIVPVTTNNTASMDNTAYSATAKSAAAVVDASTNGSAEDEMQQASVNASPRQVVGIASTLSAVQHTSSAAGTAASAPIQATLTPHHHTGGVPTIVIVAPAADAKSPVSASAFSPLLSPSPSSPSFSFPSNLTGGVSEPFISPLSSSTAGSDSFVASQRDSSVLSSPPPHISLPIAASFSFAGDTDTSTLLCSTPRASMVLDVNSSTASTPHRDFAAVFPMPNTGSQPSPSSVPPLPLSAPPVVARREKSTISLALAGGAANSRPRASYHALQQDIFSDVKMVVSEEHVRFTGKQLGSGSFGLVLEGWMRCPGERADRLVALKLLRADAPEEEQEALVAEARVMKYLSSHPHPHVVELLAIAQTARGLVLVQEHCGLGNLLDYLRAGRSMSSSSVGYAWSVRLSFASHIAKAMDFLAARDIVHRDVAARNILLTNQMCCKICDFGFSRALIDEGVYQKTSAGRVPYKWLAIESLAVGMYSEKSDVWSFGVTLWEIATLGEKPYSCIGNCDVLAYLQEGRRLYRPAGCAAEVYAVMNSCWAENPCDRPTFSSLVASIDELRLQFNSPHGKPRRSIKSRVSKMFARLIGRSPSRQSLDHETRAALLSSVAEGLLSVEQCQRVLLDFERGLLVGPTLPPGKPYAMALIERHRDLGQAADGAAGALPSMGVGNALARTDSMRTLSSVRTYDRSSGMQEEDIALSHSMRDLRIDPIDTTSLASVPTSGADPTSPVQVSDC